MPVHTVVQPVRASSRQLLSKADAVVLKAATRMHRLLTPCLLVRCRIVLLLLLLLQDLSYLLKDKYSATMQKWLSSAVWLDGQNLQTLDQYCNAAQPIDPDTRDLILAYKDNQDYSDIAGRKLGPMMWDISYGVSWTCLCATIYSQLHAAGKTCQGLRAVRVSGQPGIGPCVMGFGPCVMGCGPCGTGL